MKLSEIELANRPLVIFICLHFWRKEWWHKRRCNKCQAWIYALLLRGKTDFE